MEIRYQPDQTVRFNVLRTPHNTILSAQIVRLQGRHACLRVEERIEAGAAVRIDMDDSMLLGEVSGCWLDRNAILVSVDVHEAIPSMSDLARLVAAVMQQGRSEMPERAAIKSARA